MNDVAARFGIQPNQLSGWRRLAKMAGWSCRADGEVHEAVFAPLVASDVEVPAPGADTRAAGGGIRVVVGDVVLHLDADTSAGRIAEIVRALGEPS